MNASRHAVHICLKSLAALVAGVMVYALTPSLSSSTLFVSPQVPSVEDPVPPNSHIRLDKVSPDNNPLPAFNWKTAADKVPNVPAGEVQIDSGNWLNTGNELTNVQPTALSIGKHTITMQVKNAGSINDGVNVRLTDDTVAASFGNRKIVVDNRDGNSDIYNIPFVDISADPAIPRASTALPTNNSMAYWNFNEGSGSIATDASGNGHQATLFGGATWMNGVLGEAISLNGSTGYIYVPSGYSLDGMTGLTIDAWVFLRSYPSGTSTIGIVSKWGQGGVSDDSYTLSLDATGKFFIPENA